MTFSKTFAHGIATITTMLLIAAFVIVGPGHETSQTVLAVLAAISGLAAWLTLSLPAPARRGTVGTLGAAQSTVRDYTLRSGSDGISAVRCWALDDGARLEITVNRLGTLSAPLDAGSANAVADILEKAGDAS